jgi:hypothetical protein
MGLQSPSETWLVNTRYRSPSPVGGLLRRLPSARRRLASYEAFASLRCVQSGAVNEHPPGAPSPGYGAANRESHPHCDANSAAPARRESMAWAPPAGPPKRAHGRSGPADLVSCRLHPWDSHPLQRFSPSHSGWRLPALLPGGKIRCASPGGEPERRPDPLLGGPLRGTPPLAGAQPTWLQSAPRHPAANRRATRGTRNSTRAARPLMGFPAARLPTRTEARIGRRGGGGPPECCSSSGWPSP